MKKIILALFAISLLGSIFFYFQQRNKQTLESNKVVYNPITEKWESFIREDPIQDRKEITKNADNTNGIYNQSVLRGYFQNYDELSQTLTLHSAMSFTLNQLFENIELKLLPNQTIYCAPEIYVDPNTGKSYSISKLLMPVKDGETLWLPTERVFNFDEFLTKSNDKTFIYLQLTENYNQQTDNYIKKLIVIGLCE